MSGFAVSTTGTNYDVIVFEQGGFTALQAASTDGTMGLAAVAKSIGIPYGPVLLLDEFAAYVAFDIIDSLSLSTRTEG